MKRILLLAFVFSSLYASAQLSGTKKIGTPLSTGCAGGPCDYTSITGVGGLFQAINGAGINGNVVAQIYSNLTETGAFVLGQFSDVGGPHTVLIQPIDANMRILSGAKTGDGLIAILGGDRVIIDGRAPGDETMNYTNRFLTIRNTDTGGPAINIGNDALSCSIRATIIEGSNTTGTGVINVGGGTISGNDDLTIDFCDIKGIAGNLPRIGINMAGGATQGNDNIQITNNRIYNFFEPATGGTGINIGNYNSTVLIESNSIYQEASRTSNVNITYKGISINSASGTGFQVLNNYIGGTDANAGGSVSTISATGSRYVKAALIDIVETGFSAVSVISGNTIKNFSTTSTASTGIAQGGLTGISVTRGYIDVRDNIIGDATAGLTANYDATAAACSGIVAGIAYLTNTSGTGVRGEIEGNSIDNVVANSTGATASAATEVSGIYVDQQTGTNAITIKKNVIGNLDGVVRMTTNASADNALNTVGINVFRASVIVTLDRNKIANISSQGIQTGSYARGISSVAAGTLQVVSNQVFNIRSAADNPATSGATVGIFANNANAPALLISKNIIHYLTNPNAATVSGVTLGAVNTGVNPRIENNMITLGDAQTNDTRYLGIYSNADITGTAEIYANSIVITGPGNTGNSNLTSAFYKESATAFELRANIFLNNRSGDGAHYALGSTTASVGVSDYNLLYSSIAGNLTVLNGVSRNFAAWQGFGQDANSRNADVSSRFISVASGNLRIPDDGDEFGLIATNIIDKGSPSIAMNPVNDDVDKAHRTNITDIGASEVLVTWLGISSDWNNSANWSGGSVPSCTEGNLIKIGPGVDFQPVITTGSASFVELVILEGALLEVTGTGSLDQCPSGISPYSLIVNGTLTVSGSQSITLYGDFYQNNIFNPGTGIVSLIAGSSQYIDGDDDPIELKNLKIDGGGEKTLNQQIKISGILEFVSGVVTTSAANLLTFTSVGNYTGVSSASYINGPAAKETISTTPTFYFPIGKNGKFRAAAIEPSNNTATTFTAEYFFESAINNIGSNKESTITTVSNIEYWKIDRGSTGSANGYIHLTWDNESYVSADQADRDLLAVVRWDGSQWTNSYQISNSGDENAGEVKSGYVYVYNTYFTLGSSTINNPLPIKLLYFKAALEDAHVFLNWATEKEEYFDRFELEKASADLVFTKIATIQPILAGEPVSLREYSYVDSAPYTGYNYYRLKSIDIDGTSEYSKIAGVLYEGTGEKLSVYPNPIVGDVMKIKVPFNPTPHDKVTLLNVQGIEMLHANITISGEQEISLGKGISPGVYILRYTSPVILKTFKVIVK